MDILYETAKGTCLLEGKGTTAGQIMFDATADVCYYGAGASDSLALSSTNSIRSGPANWLYSPIAIDYKTSLCDIGVLGEAAATENQGLAFIETSTTLSDESPVNTGLCAGKNFEIADVTVSNPQRIVVDLNKFKCYVP